MNALKAVAKGLTTTLIFFLLAEAGLRAVYFVRNSMVRYVPLPYAFGDDYGPIPPWLDRLLILKNDEVLIWRNTPNVHRTYLDVFSPVHTEQDRIRLLRRFAPTLPEEFRANHTWEIRLNSEGYRGGEWTASAPPSTVRIACVGDSWTFGMPVNQDEAYPSRLGAWLHEERPDVRYEVANFGVLGYSSFQGLQLMKTRVLDFHPDVVVIGFGMNDSEVAGYRDKDVIGGGGRPRLSVRLKDMLKDVVEGSESYKFLKYEALSLRFKTKPISEYLKAQADTKGSGPVDYDSMEAWTRVSPHDYDANLREMIRLAAGQGAKTVLVDNELWNGSPYRPVLRRISTELGVPLVDSLAIIGAAREKIQHDLETTLGLAAATSAGSQASQPGGTAHVVFRVYRGATHVPKGLSIVGVIPQLGALSPNTVLMHDDGTGGDEKAGDGVWSYSADLTQGQSVFYVYTNSGAPGQWEGLDIPHVRSVDVPTAADGRPVYLPIETFGQLYMQGDDWHTDAAGYNLIARAVAGQVERLR